MNKCCEKIVDVTKISHDEWLDTRRTGIGGSDSIILAIDNSCLCPCDSSASFVITVS